MSLDDKHCNGDCSGLDSVGNRLVSNEEVEMGVNHALRPTSFSLREKYSNIARKFVETINYLSIYF